MSTPPSLLDILDTTVTLEWGDTRTIGTLLRLGGRRVVITALRAPEVGTTVYLRVEDDKSSESMALDGTCCGVAESDWGEQEVEIDVKRVGTTASAAALRNFLERHGLEGGGGVSVGRNRDNPDLKRYVYTLPEPNPNASTAPQLPVAPAEHNAPAAMHEPTRQLGSQTDMAAQVAAARSAAVDLQALGPHTRPTAPSPPPPAAVAAPALAPSASRGDATGLTDADRELADLLSSLSNDRPTPAIDIPAVSAGSQSYGVLGLALKMPRPATDENATVELSLAELGGTTAATAPDLATARLAPSTTSPTILAPAGVSSSAVSPWKGAAPQRQATSDMRLPSANILPQSATPAADHDYSEQILVQTVDKASAMAAPVMQLAGHDRASGMMARLLSKREEETNAAAAAEPTSASQLFAHDSAQRIELNVQFESGAKKKKSPGQLVRLGESKLRIHTQNLPQLYERIAVLLPFKNNPKNTITLRCEVTRVRTGEDGSEPCFDARVTAAGNSPAVMAKIRELLAEPGH